MRHLQGHAGVIVKCVIACRLWHTLQFGKVHDSLCASFLHITKITPFCVEIMHLHAKFCHEVCD